MREAAFIVVNVLTANVSSMKKYKVAYYVRDDRLEEKINTVCKDGRWELSHFAVDSSFYTVIYKRIG